MTQQTSTEITYSINVSYINGYMSFYTITFVNFRHLHLMIYWTPWTWPISVEVCWR